MKIREAGIPGSFREGRGIQSGLNIPAVPLKQRARLRWLREVELVLRIFYSEVWGWLPVLSLISSFGLLFVAISFIGSRARFEWSEPVFWSGLLLLVVPITARLISRNVTRRERIGLVILLGLTLYLVKVMHSPLAFAFPDELNALYNTNKIIQDGRLFHDNPIVLVIPLYPGLATVTSSLATLSGMSPFTAGLVVIGIARFVFVLALFLFLEQISGSSRLAGIGAIIYMSNPNFVFYVAEFSYESLALPLAMMVLLVIAKREAAGNSMQRIGLTLIALIGMSAVVITHHMTSYVFVIVLWILSIFSRLFHGKMRPGPWGLALITMVVTLTWLAIVASLTLNYLSPVFSGAVKSVVQLAVGEETGRQLFRSSSGSVAPLWERLTGLGAVGLILLGLPLGLLQIWKRQRKNAFAWLLAGASLTHFALLTLRLTPAGWETSSRSSEFLFLGIAFVLAYGIEYLSVPRAAGWALSALLVPYLVIIFLGGMVSGLQPSARSPHPLVIEAGDQLIEAQGISVAKWARTFLGSDNRMAADRSNAVLMLAYGDQYPFTGKKYGIQDMFFTPYVDESVINILRFIRIRYVVIDRRNASWDHMTGHYFDAMINEEDQPEHLIDPWITSKFDKRNDVDRILDSGNIVIYDVGAMTGVSQSR